MNARQIVLDFETDYDVSITLTHLRDGCSDGCSVIRRLADQIEAQTKPPRIPEPGLWGVVEAYDGGEREPRKPRMYVRDSTEDEDSHWTAIGQGVRIDWDDLIDPALVRPGIEDGAS